MPTKKQKEISVFLFINLFNLLLFLLVCCTLCVQVCANSDQPSSATAVKSVELFKKEDIINLFKDQAEEIKKTQIFAKDYYFPFLVSDGDVLVALAGATSSDKTVENISIVTKYFVAENNIEWKEQIVDELHKTDWKAHLGFQKKIENKAFSSVLGGFLAVAKKEKLYLLLVNYISKKDFLDEYVEISCEFDIYEGTIGSSNIQDNKITWKNEKTSLTSNNNKIDLQLKGMEINVPMFGSAFLANEDKIIFVLKAKASPNNKNITVILSLKEKKGGFDVLSFEKISEECHPYIFPWKEKIIQLSPECKNNAKAGIKELTDMENTLNDFHKPLSRMIGFLKSKSDFTTVTIYGEELILFTQEVKEVKEDNKSNLYLWISDGTRATKVGQLTADFESIAPITFFQFKEELFFIQKCKKDNAEIVCLTHFLDPQKKIKTALNAWKNNKNAVEQLCTDAEDKKIYCSTNGIVGFLFTNQENKKWKDEYLFADAIISESAKFENGLKCNGAGQGAVWAVGKSNEDQPYDFTAHGFTLLTTVTIDENVNNKDNSLLGIVFGEDKNIFGLWCTKNNNFGISEKDTVTSIKKIEKPCHPGMTYHVAFMWDTSKLSVFVNGEQLEKIDLTKLNLNQLQDITHFYFGAATKNQQTPTDVESHIIVKNALLYNRPFDKEDIEKIVEYGKLIDSNNKLSKDKNTNSEMNEENTEGSSFSGTSNTNLNTEDNVGNDGTVSTQRRESAVRAGGIFYVIYLLFGVITLMFCLFDIA